MTDAEIAKRIKELPRELRELIFHFLWRAEAKRKASLWIDVHADIENIRQIWDPKFYGCIDWMKSNRLCGMCSMQRKANVKWFSKLRRGRDWEPLGAPPTTIDRNPVLFRKRVTADSPMTTEKPTKSFRLIPNSRTYGRYLASRLIPTRGLILREDSDEED